MLFDTLINKRQAIIDEVPTFKRLQDKIRAAQKFVLSTDFTSACDLISNKEQIPELERIAPFCRLPYPLCWFELVHADRRRFTDLPVLGTEGEVLRVGWLLEQADRSSLWTAHMAWSMRPASLPPDTPTENISMIMVVFDTERQVAHTLAKISGWMEDTRVLSTMCCPLKSEYIMGTPIEKLFARAHTEPEIGKIVYQWYKDWAAEPRFIFAMLGLLNTRNVPEYVQVDKTEHNRKRAKADQPPLSSHIVLKIRAQHRASLAPTENQRQDWMRAHFVRGHFKHRATGIFWWSPFMRGHLERGYVGKDYEL